MLDYHAIELLILISILVMIFISHSDRMLPESSRKGFVLLFSIIGILAFIEWYGFYIESNQINDRNMSILRVIIMFSITPIAPIAVCSSIGEVRYDKIYKILFFVNLFIQILSAKFGFIYYVDDNSVYHRGDYYSIYLLSILISLTILFISFYQLSRKYQHQSAIILLLIGMIITVGITIQMVDPTVHSVWLSVTFSAIVLYIYYYSLLSQNDHLTLLLNRRCFDNQLQHLKKDAIIIYFDVNDFKGINDNFGHIYGDYCLNLIGTKIKRIYRFYGTCYRIGGDEFCVILTRNLKSVDKINNHFLNELQKKQYEEMNIPGVSVGYGYFSKDDMDVSKAKIEADEMMYENKRKNKLIGNQTKMNV